jgi:hypothetical protein
MHRQQRALRKIIAQCGIIVTNIERQAEWLRRASRRLGSAPVELMPVFSTVGEAIAPTSSGQRRPVMVVFGLAGTRQLAYRQLATVRDLLSTLGIQEILDVGPDCNHPPKVSGIPVNRVGSLPAENLPAVFSQARFGFVHHPWFCLAKSSVFAAYCAHGTIPVLAADSPEEADGIREGVHTISQRTAGTLRGSGWETCSRAAWSWYMGHRLHVHAQRYAKWVGEGSGSE